MHCEGPQSTSWSIIHRAQPCVTWVSYMFPKVHFHHWPGYWSVSYKIHSPLSWIQPIILLMKRGTCESLWPQKRLCRGSWVLIWTKSMWDRYVKKRAMFIYFIYFPPPPQVGSIRDDWARKLFGGSFFSFSHNTRTRGIQWSCWKMGSGETKWNTSSFNK